jgi:hypothetical protein
MIRRACLAALLTLSVSTAFGASTYDHLYAFGDSYSDNARAKRSPPGLPRKRSKTPRHCPAHCTGKDAGAMARPPLKVWPRH